MERGLLLPLRLCKLCVRRSRVHLPPAAHPLLLACWPGHPYLRRSGPLRKDGAPDRGRAFCARSLLLPPRRLLESWCGFPSRHGGRDSRRRLHLLQGLLDVSKPTRRPPRAHHQHSHRKLHRKLHRASTRRTLCVGCAGSITIVILSGTTLEAVCSRHSIDACSRHNIDASAATVLTRKQITHLWFTRPLLPFPPCLKCQRHSLLLL